MQRIYRSNKTLKTVVLFRFIEEVYNTTIIISKET
jgi:hypothetical protein